MKIYNSVAELVGGTPLVRLEKLAKQLGLRADLLAKVEFLNPAGSVKDRVAKEMIEAAEREGKLNSSATMIEPTSGNTGIGLAALAAARGYKLIITMPDTMSKERINLMKAYGAEVILTEGAKGMTGAIEKAEALAKEIDGAFVVGQFVNPANPLAHYKTTGPEIWEDTEGNIDIFVAGIGTGGTISGTGKYLKEKKESIEIVGVEPAGSAILSGQKAGAHKLQGIGAGFVPETLQTDIYDTIERVADDAAYDMARLIAKTEGLLVGISAGAALCAAVKAARKPQNVGKTVVVLLPDTGDRYLSTDLFEA